MQKHVLELMGLIGLVLLVSSLAWADTTTAIAQSIAASTPVASPTPQERITVVDNGSGSTVVFRDEKGNIIKNIESTEKIYDGIGDEHKTTYFELLRNKNILLVHADFRKRTPDEFRKAGEFKEWNNQIEYYNANGQLLFRKDNVDYFPTKISRNGGAIYCFHNGSGELDFLDYIAEKFPGEKIIPTPPHVVILSGTGNMIFEDHSNSGVDGAFFSNNGNWIFYRVDSGRKIVNLKTHQSIIIPRNVFAKYGFSQIFPDGTLLLVDSESRRKTPVHIKSRLYNPFNNSYKELNEMAEEEFDELRNK